MGEPSGRPIAVPAMIAVLSGSAFACSPAPGWRPPTPQSAFKAADVVVHVRIESVERDPSGNAVEGEVHVYKALKGTYSGNMVATGSSAMFGIGTQTVGQDYVFFFPSRGEWRVNGLRQAALLSAEKALATIAALPASER